MERRVLAKRSCCEMQVRVALIRYSDTAEAVFLLNRLNDATTAKSAVSAVPYTPAASNSNLTAALILLQSQVLSPTVTRSGSLRVGVIVTDKLAASAGLTETAAALNASGIRLISVGINGSGQIDFSLLLQVWYRE